MNQIEKLTQRRQLTRYKTVTVGGLDVFYREAGSTDAPTILLLHGFPTSSHMFRNLMAALSDQFHLIAPDYPGFGSSSMPTVEQFSYTFDRLADVIEGFIDALGLQRYSLYMFDYGAPVGFRIATRRGESVEAMVIQNGNAYDEGLRDFWDPIKAYWRDKNDPNAKVLRDTLLTLEATRWQYTNGVRDVEAIAPETWLYDQILMDRPGNKSIQLELFYDYGSNPPLYRSWQAYMRSHQPPTLIVWGANDFIFPAEGAAPYRRDLPNVEIHMLDTGHFALEEDGELIAELMRDFLRTNVIANRTRSVGTAAE